MFVVSCGSGVNFHFWMFISIICFVCVDALSVHTQKWRYDIRTVLYSQVHFLRMFPQKHNTGLLQARSGPFNEERGYKVSIKHHKEQICTVSRQRVHS